MFGNGFNTYSPSFYSQSMMFPYDVPVPQPYPSPYPVPQPYIQNMVQPVDMPVQHTIQPVVVPTPFGVPVPHPVPMPIDRPYAVPVPQPIAVPVDRPCAVPVPYPVQVPQPVPVPQPYLVREQVPVHVPYPVPVPVQQDYCASPSYRQVEYIIEEPVRIRCCRRRRRRRPCRSYSCTPAPLAPIVIPIQMPAPAPQQTPSYQVTEYIQDIYPPAQVFTEQVPVGYVVKNSVIEQPSVVQSQSNSNVILPRTSYASPSPQLLQQQLPNGQLVRRPLNVGGGGGVQNIVYRQPNMSSSHSNTLLSTSPFGTQFVS